MLNIRDTLFRCINTNNYYRIAQHTHNLTFLHCFRETKLTRDELCIGRFGSQKSHISRTVWERPKNFFSTHVRAAPREVFNDAAQRRHETKRRGIRSACPSANMTYARMHTRVRDRSPRYNAHVAGRVRCHLSHPLHDSDKDGCILNQRRRSPSDSGILGISSSSPDLYETSSMIPRDISVRSIDTAAR